MQTRQNLKVDHTTIYRWVQTYGPELEKRIKWHGRTYSTTWHVDETYIKVKGNWKYLYRAVDENSNTIDFMLSHRRNIDMAKRFFKQAIATSNNKPKKIFTDKLASYNTAIKDLQKQNVLKGDVKHLNYRYSNNIIESDHRKIKRLVNPMLGFKKFHTALRCIKGIEAMLKISKNSSFFFGNSVLDQIRFINNTFEVYA